MTTPDIQQWLQDGIAAVKRGNGEQARQLLMQVVEADERNEQAWLWLSGVVATNDERRVCLENVLAINPDSTVAKKGLLKLGGGPADAIEQGEGGQNGRKHYHVRRERTPLSAASAILYPDQQVQEWEWDEPELDIRRKGFDTAVHSQSKFDDAWESETELCPYCAQELALEDKKCPQCEHNLIEQRFRYDPPSRNMYVFFSVLIGQGNLFAAQIIYDLVQNQAIIWDNVATATLFMGAFFIVGMGVYWRQFWAYALSIAVQFLIMFVVVVSILLPVDFTLLNLPVNDPAIQGFIASFGDWVSQTIRVLQIAGASLGLLYGVLVVAPDFVRDQKRLTAVLSKNLKFASDYNIQAKKLAQKGMWATAVLHWQHAAGKEPHTISYQRQLGLAYAQLGFYDRSLDILQSAHALAATPDKQADFQRIITRVREMQNQS